MVTEAPVIPEYGGCELGGAYGIQLEQDIASAGNILVNGNTVTLNTGGCGGGVLRVTGWPSSAKATIQGNTFTVNRNAGADKDYGMLYYLDADDLSNVVFGANTLKTNDLACALIDWDGATNFTASLAGCQAPYAMGAGNGPGNNSSFNVTGAPNLNLGCGSYAVTTGKINGVTKKCGS